MELYDGSIFDEKGNIVNSYCSTQEYLLPPQLRQLKADCFLNDFIHKFGTLTIISKPIKLRKLYTCINIHILEQKGIH